jgi:alkylated DNA repair dioxygenase AlkB
LTATLPVAKIEHLFAHRQEEDRMDVAGAVVTWQTSLFGLDEPSVDPELRGIVRVELDDDSWLDHLPRWLVGSDHVFAELVARLPWHQRVVRMYDRLVDEPRLTHWSPPGAGPLPLAVLEEVRAALEARYRRTFDSVGCNFYRNGHDSVAWHGDRERHDQDESVIAIVSVGAPRPFLVRPRGGGPSQAFLLGQGDLLVMGGACQHRWEHTVPKVAAAGPRISITYRHGARLPAPVRAHPASRPGPVDDVALRASRAAHPAGRRR